VIYEWPFANTIYGLSTAGCTWGPARYRHRTSKFEQLTLGYHNSEFSLVLRKLFTLSKKLGIPLDNNITLHQEVPPLVFLTFENQKNPLKIKKTSKTQNLDFPKKTSLMINFKPHILIKLHFKGSSISKIFRFSLVYKFCGFLGFKKTSKNFKKPETKWGLLLMH